MAVRLALFSGFSNSSRVPAGNLANASSVGADTVNGPLPLRVCTSPAACNAAAKVLKLPAETAVSTMSFALVPGRAAAAIGQVSPAHVALVADSSAKPATAIWKIAFRSNLLTYSLVSAGPLGLGGKSASEHPIVRCRPTPGFRKGPQKNQNPALRPNGSWRVATKMGCRSMGGRRGHACPPDQWTNPKSPAYFGRPWSPGCLDTRGRQFLAFSSAFLIPEQELAKMQKASEITALPRILGECAKVPRESLARAHLRSDRSARSARKRPLGAWPPGGSEKTLRARRRRTRCWGRCRACWLS